MLPFVSCICLTFGREKLLNEAVQSFLNQDYQGKKELIILNDFSEQTFHFNSPEVHVINLNRKFRYIGEKRNAATSLAKGSVFFPWDDDDISLPFRISQSVDYLNEHQLNYYKPSSAFAWNNGSISEISKNAFHAQCCYTKELFYKINGYKLMSKGEDVDFDHRVMALGEKSIDIKDDLNYYFYRWAGTGSYHLSSCDEDNNEARLYLKHKVLARNKALATGDITIEPKWNDDYMAQRNEFLKSLT